jgi:amino acid transporter
MLASWRDVQGGTDMTATTVEHGESSSKGLKAGALGLVATTVIAVASTAPGYSLAAGIGGINEAVGVKAPFIMLFAFIPMGCIAAAFFYLNRADADCGTTFAWGTRAFGPSAGWLGSWGLIVADLLIMPNLAGISGRYLLLLFGAENAADNFVWQTMIGVAFIIAMCWICWKGIELSARTQVIMLTAELVILVIFAVVAIGRAFGGVTKTVDGVTYESVTPSLSWLLPTDLSSSALTAGLVLAVFAYWGWDTAVSVNEECEDANRTPGTAAVLSVFILLAIYIVTSFGTQAFLGPEFVVANSDDAVSAVGKEALGSFFDKFLIISVLTSAAASCQTTILPATRSMLSMGSHGAAPPILARIDRKRLTPDVATFLFGAVSVVWYVGLVLIAQNTSTDAYGASIAAVGLAIAFYYGISGYACVWYYRGYLTKSLKNFVLIGVLPLVGAIILTYVFVKTILDAADAAYWGELDEATGEYVGGTLFGLGTVLVIGTILLVLGIPLMLWCRKRFPGFWRIKPDPAATIPDPSGDGGTAAPLGTYLKGK